MSKQVIERLTRYHNQRRVQPYWVFNSSKLAGEEMDESRSRMAALLNVSNSSLHFGPSTSQNTYVLANAFKDLQSQRKLIPKVLEGIWIKIFQLLQPQVVFP